MQAQNIIDTLKIAASTSGKYANVILDRTNNHLVRLSVMTSPFYWHQHPNSDETFMVLEGILAIDFLHTTIELSPGQIYTVPLGTVHRTRPINERSVNITFELADMQTMRVDF
ncbi:MAG: Cupin 2 conserved barrel domain protein [Chitinophagaceae bacterium]|nr:Cupin 2 conserved barrel domain protein [Chitinophagaceae bacterium]